MSLLLKKLIVHFFLNFLLQTVCFFRATLKTSLSRIPVTVCFATLMDESHFTWGGLQHVCKCGGKFLMFRWRGQTKPSLPSWLLSWGSVRFPTVLKMGATIGDCQQHVWTGWERRGQRCLAGKELMELQLKRQWKKRYLILRGSRGSEIGMSLKLCSRGIVQKEQKLLKVIRGLMKVTHPDPVNGAKRKYLSLYIWKRQSPAWGTTDQNIFPTKVASMR